MIKFACSNCGQSIRVDDRHAGKQGKCPKCGSSLVVPDRLAVIQFRCGSCGAKVRVPERYAGKQGRCPKCKKAVVVPAARQGPAGKTAGPTLTCSMCGRTIEVVGDPTEPFVECPGCGSYLDASTGSLAAEPATQAPSETDEDFDKEPATAPKTSAGPNRRPLILAGSALVLVVVGVVGLVLFLRSTGSAPVKESPIPRRRPEAVRLQFRPSPGTRRTMRVTTRLAISSEEGGQQSDVVNTQSFTADLEAAEAHADGSTPITVALRAIQVQTEMDGATLGEYDSAKPQSENDSMAGIYVPFVGKRFTIRVSGQGELLDPGLDELFLAVAADRVAAEDDMMREQLKEKAEAAIEKTDQHYGSRRSRTVALKQQFEESIVFGADEVRCLLDHLIVPCPAEPVRGGSRWNGPVAARVGARLEMPGAYTVTALEENSCTIAAEGQRSMEEEPFIYQVGSTTVSNKLAGSSQIGLTVDRPTGWLLAKEQKTTLSGRVLRTTAAAPGQQTFSDVAM